MCTIMSPKQSLIHANCSTVILLISIVTVVHTALDLALYHNASLPPVYTLYMSVIMVATWIIGIGIGVTDLKRRNVAPHTGAKGELVYGYCLGTREGLGYYRRSGCLVPRARLLDEVFVL